MTFSKLVEVWLNEDPQALIIGYSEYAQALAKSIDGFALPAEDLNEAFPEIAYGGIPQIWADLKQIIYVTDLSQSPAELITCHRETWKCLEMLSPEGDQHELITLFMLPSSEKSRINTLIAYWGLTPEEARDFGLGFAAIGDTLESICNSLASIQPCDLPPLVARQASNSRHKAIRQLKQVAGTSQDAARSEVRDVCDAFKSSEYLLDLFCRPPAHRNGNRLRAILNEVETDSIKADEFPDRIKEIAQILK